MNVDLINTDMNVVYGSCKQLVEIKSSTTTLDTQIRDVGSGSLSDVVSLEILTFESNQQIEVDSVDLTLTEENSSTNLLTTSLEASFKLVDKTKLKFKPGIWTKGKTYVLTAVAHKDTLIGKSRPSVCTAQSASILNLNLSRSLF
eukprot:CAMPEP_0168339920 /NCGR_PEP_ID=MMETSP0213-20121227/13754_1 /TAXON_ID=151035 /ORGANISM="Euplotes harpa, Strain FSP1.4" /LENGTH=144 /DNA_ID=CAMNT_0008346055 /DNA_START=334 /DNA_END=768 /DNA_ORIENTATION=-